MAQSHDIPCWAKTLLHLIETVVITTIEVAVYPWSKVPALVCSNFNWDCTCNNWSCCTQELELYFMVSLKGVL